MTDPIATIPQIESQPERRSAITDIGPQTHRTMTMDTRSQPPPSLDDPRRKIIAIAVTITITVAS